ncbi:MAG: ABC transporter ATP-binding protein [Gemmatimonadales bacterium]
MSHPPMGTGLGRNRRNDQPPASRRERLAALRYIIPLLKLVYETHRRFTIGMMMLRLVRAFVPIATFWVGKLILDTVIAVRDGHANVSLLWEYVAIEIGIIVVAALLARASALIESLLSDLFSNRMSIRLMEHSATLDLAQFEDPTFYDHLERARRQTVGRIALLTQVVSITQEAITLLTIGGVLIAYSPWMLVLLVLAVLPSFLGETHFASLGYSLLFRWTPERRQLDYLRVVGASNITAKEVQMFGLAPWLTERYRVLSNRFYEENKTLSLRRGAVSASLSIFGTLGYYIAYVIIIMRAVRGEITPGTLIFLSSSFARGRDTIQGILLSASGVYEQALYLRDLFVFLEMKPTIFSRPDARPVPTPIIEGFVFEEVGFRYPESDRWAVRNISMVLSPGERVALVGENGAGKTTITKLIARLYEPTEGRITLDGVDLRDYDLGSLRHAIGVIFQDFVRYDMRFDENIGVGEIESVRAELDSTNGEPVPAMIEEAAKNSLAESLLPRFPNGYRQMLGRRFEEGVDLSGGEWQKVALARAYLRDAQVLILDEPTAALDARAEYEVFMRFSELVAGRMAILISHRFSTVRMADRIIVLKGGRVEESGTHEELVAGGGLYEELFRMQAAGYR